MPSDRIPTGGDGVARAFLVQLTDPHVVTGPAGDAAASALADAVDAVLRLPAAPAAVLVSGDLADDGAADSYDRVKELLDPLPAPVLALAGNHDDPERLHATFGRREEIDIGELRLLLCDTHVPGSDAGHLDVAVLERRLDARPTILAMHHPPLVTGIKAIDDFGLPAEDRSALEDLLARSPQVLRVVCGHVHRTTVETLGGCAVFTCPSTFLQAEPGPEPGTLAFVPRGRAFAIHSLLGDSLVSQLQPIA